MVEKAGILLPVFVNEIMSVRGKKDVPWKIYGEAIANVQERGVQEGVSDSTRDPIVLKRQRRRVEAVMPAILAVYGPRSRGHHDQAKPRSKKLTVSLYDLKDDDEGTVLEGQREKGRDEQQQLEIQPDAHGGNASLSIEEHQVNAENAGVIDACDEGSSRLVEPNRMDAGKEQGLPRPSSHKRPLSPPPPRTHPSPLPPIHCGPDNGCPAPIELPMPPDSAP
jgi:hypothetical protein